MKRLQFSFREKVAVAAMVFAVIAGCYGTKSTPFSDSNTGTTQQTQMEQVSESVLTEPKLDNKEQAIESLVPDHEVEVGPLVVEVPKIDRLFLYSLKCNYDYAVEPDKLVTDERENFQGVLVLGKVEVTEPTNQRKILDALDQARKEGDGIAKCFYPRHGVRVVKGDLVTDYLICFECSYLRIFLNGMVSTESAPISRHAQPVFNDVLDEARVPLMPEARRSH